MRPDTPPPEELSDDVQSGYDDIEIIEDSEIEGYFEEAIDVADEAKITFEGHSGAVFCCAFDKNGQYAVSGGQDDKAFVWNVNTGTTAFECKGHKDSVSHVSFNFDSKFVTSGDMSGFVQVWDCTNDSHTPYWEYDMCEDLRFLEWHNGTNHLFAGAADGNCWMWEVPKQGEPVQPGQMFHSYGTGCVCGCFTPDGEKSVVGYEDGSVRVWDLSAALLHSVQGHAGHSDAVTVLDCHPNNNLVISGSIDGTVKLLKTADGKVLYTIRCAPDDIEQKSVEGVGFFSSQQLFATGTVCGSLAIWDIPTKVRRLQYEQESGITQLICDSTRPMVYTSGIDGFVRLFDARTGQEENNWGGHSAAILSFRISSCGTYILTASEDSTCKVFDMR